MSEFETLIGLLLVAVILAAAARRVGALYPAFLALGGAVLAFVPGMPAFTIDPELALALFVAPVLLDAAYDTSPRDLRDNWAHPENPRRREPPERRDRSVDLPSRSWRGGGECILAESRRAGIPARGGRQRRCRSRARVALSPGGDACARRADVDHRRLRFRPFSAARRFRFVA